MYIAMIHDSSVSKPGTFSSRMLELHEVDGSSDILHHNSIHDGRFEGSKLQLGMLDLVVFGDR